MAQSSFTKKLLGGHYLGLSWKGMIEGKRDRGRQRRTWGDDVKEWSGCQSIGSAKIMSEDNRRWRVMVINLLIEHGT